jgi:membrane peptidoglycan carboxypeptidase
MRRALAPSLNIAAVMALNEVGVPAMLETAHRMGITTMEDPSKYGLSVTLGAGDVTLLDITYAYQGFANGGKQVGDLVPLPERRPGMREYDPVAVLKIVDSLGNTVYEYEPPEGTQVITPQEAWMITDILADDDAHAPTYGYNSFLVLDRPAAAKTGTTEFYQDGWLIGYTADLLTGVWTGNTNGEPMKGVFGVSGAGVIWHNYMIPAHEHLGLPPKPFPIPQGVARGTQCGSRDWYVVGREPQCFLGPRSWAVNLKGAPPLAGEPQPAPIKPVGSWQKPSLEASNPWLPASSQWAPKSGLPAPVVPGLTAPGTIPTPVDNPMQVRRWGG